MGGDSASANLLWIAAATFAALATGTIVRLLALRHASGPEYQARIASLKTWWVVAIAVLGAALLGRIACVLLFAVVSGAALREFAALRPGLADRRASLLAAALMAASYAWIGGNRPEVFCLFLPLAAPALFGASYVVAGQVEQFGNRVANWTWGLLLTAYLPAYAVLLLTLPQVGNPIAGGGGWFLFLILTTEANDILQALWGRRFGKRRMTPRVSPCKTWAGLIGGVITATLFAVVAAGYLTPLNHLEAAVAGLLIALSGTLGDLNISALKRDAGVKDSSQLLPGQGGMLDRIDSLTFSAPAFYYYVLLLPHVKRVLTA